MTEEYGDEEFVELDKLTVPAIVDALTDNVERARALPMSSSVLVNKSEMLDLLDQLRELVPTELTRADEVLTDAGNLLADSQVEAQVRLEKANEHAESIVANANEQAAHRIKQANDQATQLVQEDRLVKLAEQRAAEIVAEAEETAKRLRLDADQYCDKRLADFEIDLGKVLTQVQAGRNKLAERLTNEQ